jgi:vancomycin resistance protein VanJ
MGISSFLQRTFKGLTWIMALLLLLACIVPYVPLAAFAFLSLMVPLLAILNAVALLFWLIVKRKLLWHVLAALVIGYVGLGTFVRFGDGNASPGVDGLKVMSYNVQGFFDHDPDGRPNVSQDIALFISEQDPGIICFQEYSNIIRRQLPQYPYISQTPFGNDRVNQAIFSKYPIVGEASLDLPHSTNNAIYADIVYQGDTLRVYNVHLESLNIRPNNLKQEASRKLFGRLQNSFSKQHAQAELLREHAEASPYRNIFCTDMNNNQFSYTYKTLKGPMTDTFSEKGQGYGRTIDFWRFPLRIDFILVDAWFQVGGHSNYAIGLSDHEPVMATLGVPR